MSKLTKEMVERQDHLQMHADKYLIDLSNLGLVSIKNFDMFLRVDRLEELILEQNNLKSIEPIVKQINNQGVQLQYLFMPLNFIKVIENVDLPILQQLNLSTNKITILPQIQTPKLKVLDVSNNYIELVQELTYSTLESLNLSGNKITFLPKMSNMPRLRALDLSRNNLTSLTRLLDNCPYLSNLNAAYNHLELGYMDELCTVIQSLSSLEEIDLKGNEVTQSESYEFKLLEAKPSLRYIDNLELNENIILNMVNKGKEKQFDKLVHQTKEQYLQWMQDRERARREILHNLTLQKQKVNELFDNKREESFKEMNDFFEYVKSLKQNNIDSEQLELWRQKLEKSENMRIQSMQLIRQQQIKNKEQAISNQLSTKTMLQKLYDIALNEPEVWRQLKRQELGEPDEEVSNPMMTPFDQRSQSKKPSLQSQDQTVRSYRSNRSRQ